MHLERIIFDTQPLQFPLLLSEARMCLGPSHFRDILTCRGPVPQTHRLELLRLDTSGMLLEHIDEL